MGRGLCLFLTVSLGLQLCWGCTTGVIGRLATTDGATYVFGTSDTENGDFRAAVVRGKKHKAGSTRRIYPLKQVYPHLVSEDRSFTWSKENLEDLPQKDLWNPTEPIFSIPQVNETYSLIETGAGYGLVNEFGVAMGESTCGARFVQKPIFDGGYAAFEIGELSQIALERTKTARDAIKLMGSLAEQHGYYGAFYNDPAQQHNEAGEALTVADGKEAWVFHITPDDTGKSAVWCAQRVPDDSFSIVANRFVIREVVENSDDFLYSSNIFEIARRHGLWRKEQKLDFVRVYGPLDDDLIKYSTDRVWRAAQLWNPSRGESRENRQNYPTNFHADRPISFEDVNALLRDHYEGSEIDLTKGIESGPFGDPDRYDKFPGDGLSAGDLREHSFLRAISMFRSIYYFIQRSDTSLPKEVNGRVLMGFHEPSESIAVPLYVCSKTLPKQVVSGSMFAYDDTSLYWAATLLGNWVHKAYVHIHPFVMPLINNFETNMYNEMDKVEEEAAVLIKAGKKDEAITLLEGKQLEWSIDTREFLRTTFYQIVSKFHDGLVYVSCANRFQPIYNCEPHKPSS